MRATRVVLFKAEEPRSETHRGSREVANGLTPTRTVRTRCLRQRGAAQSANASAHEQIFRAINGQSEAARRSAFRPANSERQVPLRVDGCRPPRPCRVVSAPTADAPTATAIPGAAGCTSSARHCSGSSTRPTDPGRPGWLTPQPSRVRRSARGGLTSTYSAGDRWQKTPSAAVAHAGSCRSLTPTGIKQSLDATIGAGLNGGSERCGRWTVRRMTVPGQRPLLSRSRERRVQRWPYSVNTKSLFFATL
jgi:hypothetical protein